MQVLMSISIRYRYDNHFEMFRLHRLLGYEMIHIKFRASLLAVKTCTVERNVCIFFVHMYMKSTCVFVEMNVKLPKKYGHTAGDVVSVSDKCATQTCHRQVKNRVRCVQ